LPAHRNRGSSNRRQHLKRQRHHDQFRPCICAFSPALAALLPNGPIGFPFCGNRRRALIISVKPETVYERWLREGAVTEATARLDHAPRACSPRGVEEILTATGSDH
jgi:hypothetical protein